MVEVLKLGEIGTEYPWKQRTLAFMRLTATMNRAWRLKLRRARRCYGLILDQAAERIRRSYPSSSASRSSVDASVADSRCYSSLEQRDHGVVNGGHNVRGSVRDGSCVVSHAIYRA
jgi:hypothetical protein